MKEVHDFSNMKDFWFVAFLPYVVVNKGNQEIRDAAGASGLHVSFASLRSHSCSNTVQHKVFQSLKYFVETLLKM